MKITAVRTTPLFLAYRQPYHWAQGVNEGTEMVLVEAARAAAEADYSVIYVKIGRGRDLDVEIAGQVRAAIGSRRLRLDVNEAGDVLTAVDMIRRLAPFEPELIEQSLMRVHLRRVRTKVVTGRRDYRSTYWCKGIFRTDQLGSLVT